MKPTCGTYDTKSARKVLRSPPWARHLESLRFIGLVNSLAPLLLLTTVHLGPESRSTSRPKSLAARKALQQAQLRRTPSYGHDYKRDESVALRGVWITVRLANRASADSRAGRGRSTRSREGRGDQSQRQLLTLRGGSRKQLCRINRASRNSRLAGLSVESLGHCQSFGN